MPDNSTLDQVRGGAGKLGNGPMDTIKNKKAREMRAL